MEVRIGDEASNYTPEYQAAEYIELEGKQPSRGTTHLGALLLFFAIVVAGGLAVFGMGALQSHFLSTERYYASQTVQLELNPNMPSFKYETNPRTK